MVSHAKLVRIFPDLVTKQKAFVPGRSSNDHQAFLKLELELPMDKSNILEACKAELEAAGQLEALRCIQSLESRIQGSSKASGKKASVV